MGLSACSCFACCCPCLRDGQTASLLESNGQSEGMFNINCLLTCCAGVCIGTPFTRMQLRQKLGYVNAEPTCCLIEGIVTCLVPVHCCLSEQAYQEAKLKTQGKAGAPQVQEEMGAPEPVAQIGAPVEKEMEV